MFALSCRWAPARRGCNPGHSSLQLLGPPATATQGRFVSCRAGSTLWNSSEIPWNLEGPRILRLCDVNRSPGSPSVTSGKGLGFKDTAQGHECGFFCFPAVCPWGSCSPSLGCIYLTFKGEVVVVVVMISANPGNHSVCSGSSRLPDSLVNGGCY